MICQLSQLLSKSGNYVFGKQQPSEFEFWGVSTLAKIGVPDPGEHHGGEHRSLPGGGGRAATGSQDSVLWI